ncbi:MAG: S41 family peptidase [Phycisphaerales bacterium]|nr:S41 family peptidase [Phycisphaerales bacterium]
MPLRIRRFASVLSLCVVVGGGGSIVVAQGPVSAEAGAWSGAIWSAGIAGDTQGVTESLDAAPAQGMSPAAMARYLENVDRWRSNRVDDQTAIEARRAEAWQEMLDFIEADDIFEAIRRLVEVQSLSESVDAPLRTEEALALVADLRARIDAWTAAGQLMPAQEAVFMLHAALEDSSEQDTAEALDAELDRLTEQIRLLRRYAFPRFHTMLVEHGESKGETPNREYSPRLVDRWKEEVAGVTAQMAVDALALSEAEHVERVDMRTMLHGGIDAVRGVAETPGLSDTFEGLGDDARVAAFVGSLDDCKARLDVPGSAWDEIDTVTHLLQANAQSVGLPEAVVLREFVDGCTAELDRFSAVIWPFDMEQFQRQMEGEFVGIGVQISESPLGEIVVNTPLEGKPAFFAGLQPDDVIVEVDGQSTAGWTVHDAVRHITGPRNTTVVLGISREGEDESLIVPIVRDVIRMPTVAGWMKEDGADAAEPSWDWFIDQDMRIGYIKLTGFDKQTYLGIRRGLGEMRTSGPINGLILDLRQNPGGLLDVAADISNLWVPRGPIVTGENRDGERTFSMSARPTRCLLAGTPTVVLVNKGSASASEIVAGCLQAHDAAVIIGDRSFGKGSVQTVHGIAPDARIKVTSQYYRLPSEDGVSPGRLVHRRPGSTDWGVVPDLKVDMSMDDIEDAHRLRARAEAAASSLPWARERAAEVEAEEGPADINRLITDGFDPQLELGLLMLQAQALSRTPPTADEAIQLAEHEKQAETARLDSAVR